MNFDSRSEFFDSEMVQASLEDIKELQDLITNSIIETAFSSEDAMLVAENMRESLRQMGMPRGATVEQMFDNLKGSIRKLRETLDN